MATELATAYIALVPSGKDLTANVAAQLGGAGVTGAAAIEGQVAGASKRGGASITKYLTAAFKGAAVVGGAAIGAAVGLYKIGSSFDDATDTIAIKTGATGKQLDSLKQSFDNVVKSVPSSFGDASTAIGTLAARRSAPLAEICGVHLLTAGALAGILGPGRRFASDAQLAAYAGAAPLEASSAERVRHRSIAAAIVASRPSCIASR